MRLVCLIVTAGTIAISTSTMAQESRTPAERAMFARVSAEVIANLQCAAGVETLNDKLTAQQAEIKRLTDKYEPKSEKE